MPLSITPPTQGTQMAPRTSAQANNTEKIISLVRGRAEAIKQKLKLALTKVQTEKEKQLIHQKMLSFAQGFTTLIEKLAKEDRV